jgi:hypothetical protein
MMFKVMVWKPLRGIQEAIPDFAKEAVALEKIKDAQDAGEDVGELKASIRAKT